MSSFPPSPFRSLGIKLALMRKEDARDSLNLKKPYSNEFYAVA